MRHAKIPRDEPGALLESSLEIAGEANRAERNCALCYDEVENAADARIRPDGCGSSSRCALLASHLIVIAVPLVLGRPVLFLQRRPGLHAKPFTIFKFRSFPFLGLASTSTASRSPICPSATRFF